jgi:hydrogenase nickel incorporation protein HypA/HybF
MHELSVTESLLEIAQRHAAQAGARRVTDLYLVIGRLASIVDDSVQFYWDSLSQGTICEGARLHFERLPAKLMCLNCGETYLLEEDLAPCPKCGSDRVQVLGGTEFHLDSIGVET